MERKTTTKKISRPGGQKFQRNPVQKGHYHHQWKCGCGQEDQDLRFNILSLFGNKIGRDEKYNWSTNRQINQTIRSSEVGLEDEDLRGVLGWSLSCRSAQTGCKMRHVLYELCNTPFPMKHLLSPCPRLSRWPPSRSNWSPSPWPSCPNLCIG